MITTNEDQTKGFFESQGKLKDSENQNPIDKISPIETSLNQTSLLGRKD